MNVTGTPYRCDAGHEHYLTYRVDTVRAWCDACGAMTGHTAVRQAPEAVRRHEPVDLSNIITGKFRQLAATFDASARGEKVVLTPRPASDMQSRIMAALTAAHFPDRHVAKLPTMDALGQQTAASVHAALKGDGPRIVIMWGDYGTGKTQTATAVAMLRAQAGLRTRYVSAPDLTRALRDNFHTRVPEGELLRRFHECAGLVIDEIQAALDESPEKASWARTQIQGIVDARYATGKPLVTILIGNADSLATLSRRLGAHIISRAQECGQIFEIKRNNYRAEAARRFRLPHAD